MPFARCSSLDQLLACAGDAVLRGTAEKSESTKEAADWGTMVHHWKETGEVVAVNGRKNLVPLFEKKLKATKLERLRWWPDGITHETAVAIDPLTAYGSMIEGTKQEKEDWKSSQSERWLTGTVDGWWMMFDTLYVDDLKTGKQVSWEEYQWQVTAYALGIARMLDYRGPVHTTLTHWPRYPVLSQPTRFGRVIEQEELKVFEKRLVVLREDILRGWGGGEVELVPGEQCLWCRSRGICPEMNGTKRN